MEKVTAIAQYEVGSELRDWLGSGVLILLCVMLTRQMQLRDFNIALSVGAACVGVLTWRSATDYWVRVAFLYFSMSLLHGLLTGAAVGDAVRFFAILTLTLSAFFFARKTAPPIGTIVCVGAVQAFVVMAIGGFLAWSQDARVAELIRVWARDQTELGDIYSLNGIFYRVQLVGNALLPFFLFICVHFRRHWYARALMLPFAISVAIAGNLTYWIASLLYLLYEFRSRFKNPLVAVMIASLLAYVCSFFLWDAFVLKFSQDSGSMGIRFDQLSAIWSRMGREPSGFLFGFGLGARLPDGVFRDYSESLYIELQSAYVFFQIGAIGLLLYAGCFFYLSGRYIDKDLRAILFAYVFASITNPYVFDTNQVFVTALLAGLSGRGFDRE